MFETGSKYREEELGDGARYDGMGAALVYGSDVN